MARSSLIAALVLTIADPGGDVFAQRAASEKTARITGVVLADDTGTPLAGVSVRALGEASVRSDITDEQGQFEIDAPAPDIFFVTAVTAGYLMGSGGQRTPADVPSRIEVEPGSARHLEIRLLPLGSIAGHITDQAGQPVAGVQIHAVRKDDQVGGCRECATVTDANGEYTLRGLRSGSYYVLAVAAAAGPSLDDATVLGMPFQPARGMPTFYPGTAFPNEATTVTVRAGLRAVASFAPVAARLTRVTGVVVDSRGGPARDSLVFLSPKAPAPRSVAPRLVELDEDGQFELAEVPPGDYLLAVRSKGALIELARTGGSGVNGFTGELANVLLRIPGDPVEGLRVQTTTGFDVSGTIVMSGGRLPRTLGRPVLTAQPTEQPAALLPLGGVRASLEPDATFRLENLLGSYLIRATTLPRDLMVRRVIANGVDVIDEGVTVSQHLSIEIEVGTATQLSGRVVTRRGDALPGMTVVVFAEDPLRWSLPSTRYVRSVTADAVGSFSIQGLPAGRYFAAAVPGEMEGRTTAVDELEALIPRATRTDFGDGETKSITIRID